MQEARPEAEAGRDALAVADHAPDRLQRVMILLVALDVGEQREVVAGRKSPQMRAQVAGQRASLAESGAFFASAKSATPSPAKSAASGGSAPVFSYSSVSARVATLLASTSGWSNGLMPRIAPATPSRISQRKNSWPRS